MSKAVLISIRPKWCELIASGKKTIEVRKTEPKVKTPFKCYIYCTKDPGNKGSATHFFESDEGTFWSAGKTFAAFLSGTVIGEFVCDKMIKFSTRVYLGEEQEKSDDEIVSKSCVPRPELRAYEGSHFGIYDWHISNLVIYDEPKQLCEFGVFRTKHVTEKAFFQEGVCDEIRHVRVLEPLRRPPQSWCYVETLEDQ